MAPAPNRLDKPLRFATLAIGQRKRVTPRAMRRSFQYLAREAQISDIVTP